MSGNPWLKFFPSSWRSDPALRSCSVAARGLWIDMLCLMHEGEPRGHLCLPNGQMIDERRLGKLCCLPLNDVRKLLAELRRNQVFGFTDRGVIFSRRMVRDNAKAQRDRENGRTGGNPQIVRTSGSQGVNPPLNPGVNPGVKHISPLPGRASLLIRKRL